MKRDNTQKIQRTAPRPLTATAITNMRPGTVLADGAIRPGFGSLKVRKRKTAGGVVTEWLFESRRDGKTARLTIGRHSVTEAEGALTLPQARTKATALQELVRNGKDPAGQRELERQQAKNAQRAAIAEVREAQDKNLSALLDAYVDSLRSKSKERSAYDAKNLFDNHVRRPFPELAALPAASIRPEHVTRVLARLVGPDVTAKKGRTALKLRACMGAAFKLALGASTDPMAPTSAAGFKLTFNPAAAVPATSMAARFNRAGERVLSAEELTQYLVYVDALPSTLTRIALRLQLALGGQRIRQLLRLSVDDIAGDSITLFDPKGKRAEARRHELPAIHEVAELIDMLRELRDAGDPGESRLLFATNGIPMAAETLSAAVHDISEAMIEANQAERPFRGGDIRRTAETMLGERLGVDKDTRAQLLSHGLSGVQDRHYDRGTYLERKGAALRKWNDYLADLCIGQPNVDSNVVQLNRRHA